MQRYYENHAEVSRRCTGDQKTYFHDFSSPRESTSSKLSRTPPPKKKKAVSRMQTFDISFKCEITVKNCLVF